MKETAALIGILAFSMGSVIFAAHEHVKLVKTQAEITRLHLLLDVTNIMLNKLDEKSEEEQETSKE